MKSFIAATFAALAAAAPVSDSFERSVNETFGEHVARTDAPFGIKKGLAYNDGSVTNTLSRSGSATWAYNWGADMNAPKFQQIPMCWGLGGDCNAAGINKKIDAGDTPWVLGYNEPDFRRPNGCQATPQQAYDAWGNDMFKFSNRGAKLVCPAVSSWETTNGDTGGPSGLVWLRQFASIGNNPSQFRCDAQALHWYGVDGVSGAAQAQLFIDYLNHAHAVVNDIFGRNMDIWVTEFSPLPFANVNPQVMSDFLNVAIPWLDAQPWIARYAPFKAEYLVSGTSLNVAGNTFVNRS